MILVLGLNNQIHEPAQKLGYFYIYFDRDTIFQFNRQNEAPSLTFMKSLPFPIQQLYIVICNNRELGYIHTFSCIADKVIFWALVVSLPLVKAVAGGTAAVASVAAWLVVG